MKKTLKNKKGFTLIELIVSLAIFAIASVMLITIIITAMQISMRASAKTKTHLKSEQAVEDTYIPAATVDPSMQPGNKVDGMLLEVEQPQDILITIKPR